MKRLLTKKRVGFGLLVLLVGVIAYLGITYYPYFTQGAIGAGIRAKNLCSGIFVSGREEQNVIDEDISFHPLFDLIKLSVDYDNKEVTASIYGIIKNTAIFHHDLGAVLLSGRDAQEIRSWATDIPPRQPKNPEEIPWPNGDLIAEVNPPAEVDMGILQSAVDQAFSDPDPDRPWRTRGVVVVHDGKLIAEKYAEGIKPDTPLIGWSMSKSVTSALVGILVGRGQLNIQDAAGFPEWSEPGDERAEITLDMLLRMSSGLKFEEAYEDSPLSDVNRMLFTKADMGKFAADFPLEAPPDTKFSYSSGTTMLLSRLIRESFTDSLEYLSFPRKVLFNKIGMRSAVFEPDSSGTFVGASCVYASARDWARFGLLYINDGVWEGERILPEGWVEYSITPSSTAERGNYGAQFWLNRGRDGAPRSIVYPDLPRDMFYCNGYQGQFVVVIPSKKLVIVRLGMTTHGSFPFARFVAGILKSVKD
ncbi:serine hydrolase domain-containing protein [Acidobacteriota bacterium]